ncbi:MAG: two-component sensor histidine kinase [Bernardetiaceae bacterium]|nr:two-component sensor histidine kinase [Bernardetiaceae bacterium]
MKLSALADLFVSSRGVALLLAIFISLVTSAFLSLVPSVGIFALSVAALISFASSFLLIYITFEFLIFKEINNIYQKLSRIKKKDFKAMPISNMPVSANPIRRVNQEITAYASQKQSEIEELRKLETFRREFIADVSHELKTPIFAAQGFILTLLDGAINDENVREKFLKKSAKIMDSLGMLVQDLLTLSQIESGDIAMRHETFNIVEIAEEVIEQLEDRAEERNVSLKLKCSEDALWVIADPYRISQVLVNLAVNAIKYGRENGNVDILIEPRIKNIKISVIDDGAGISPEHQSRIFERFYRIEKSRSKREGGTGLGLSIVKHILERHESQINVKSEEGKGTCFYFKLPKATPPPAEKPQTDNSEVK